MFLYSDNGVYTFGSTKALNDLVSGSSQFQNSAALSPQFQILNLDENNDGKTDQIEVKVHLTTDGSKVRNVAVLQTVVYSIEDSISADIKSRFINTFSTPGGMTALSSQGTLVLNQKENFALGQVERQIGMQTENELELMLQKQDILSIIRQE